MTLVVTSEPNNAVFASDRRSADRMDVVIWARIGLADDSEYPARITNVSMSGLMAMTPCPATADVSVRIKLPEIGWVDSGVAWRMADRIGLAFDQGLTEEQLSLLAPYCL
jgi:hypothetical protein